MFGVRVDTKGRPTQSHKYRLWGADPVGPISTKNGKVVRVHDVIIHFNFGFNIFRGLRSKGVQESKFPFSHWLFWSSLTYNSAGSIPHGLW